MIRKVTGFTLVEMLVVLAVLSIVGILILTIFTRTLKGSNKAQIIGSIKQNGQLILETMDKTIRNSDYLVCISLDSKSLVVVRNGIYTRYRFIIVPGANGLIKQDNPSKETVGVDPDTSNERTDPNFVNKVCANNDTLIEPDTLTDTNIQSGVSVISLTFTEESHKAGYKDIINVTFTLAPGVGAPASIAGQIDPVAFQTTIQLR